MQFSTFKKNLDNWQGASLIFGVLEEEISSQLEKIKFVIDPKLLLKKATQKKFKGEKGKTLSFEFLDQKLETLFIVGCLLYTSPSPRDMRRSRMPSSA